MTIIVILIFLVVLLFGIVVFRGSPYVPSQTAHVRAAFSKLYKLGNDDLLVDIGSYRLKFEPERIARPRIT